MIDTISTKREERSRTAWFGFFLFVAVTVSTCLVTIVRSNHRAGVEVCELIRKHYFRAAEKDVVSFLDRCDREAEDEPYTLSKARAIKRINRRLSALKSSHLSVYTPVENRQIWTNSGDDTGIRARRIDGEIVVVRLLPESPAAKAGVKVGDAIALLNGEPADEDEVASTAGRFRIARGHRLIDFVIDLADLSDDLGPVLSGEEGGVGILRIGSFLGHYFDDDRWTSIAAKLSRYRGIVIDVRGNSGGSFPAGLRAMSPFFCSPTTVGDLWTTAEGREEGISVPLVDDLDTRPQIEAIERSRIVRLTSFEGYGCFDGPVTVLVDQGTSSVAEVFSDAFTRRKNSRVWGTPSSGRVVMARWFEIGSLGGGDYAMSIPVAGYRTSVGRELENDGVDPQKILIYDLELALRGRDNWIEEAKSSVSLGASPRVSK